MSGPVNTLYIMGADARGVVLGATQAKQAMNGMVSHAAGVNRKLATANQGIFNQTAQYAFAAQDIITVLSMGGGMSRALLSAANNIAFVASAAGTMKGALASVAITLGAAFLPKIVMAAAGIRDMREELEKLNAEQMRDFEVASALARRRESLRQDLVGAGNGDPASRVTELQRMQQQQRDLLLQEQAGIRSQRQLLQDQVREASRLQDQVVSGLESGLKNTPFAPSGLPISWRQAITNLRIITHDIFGGAQTNIEQQADAAQNTLRQMEQRMKESTLTAEEYARALERISIALGKADQEMRKPGKLGEFSKGDKFEWVIKESVLLEEAKARARQQERAELESMIDLHSEILALQQRQVSLVTAGTNEHANEMQRLRQVAFDSQVNGNQGRDEELRSMLRRLTQALANGVRLVPVQ